MQSVKNNHALGPKICTYHNPQHVGMTEGVDGTINNS